MTTTENACSIDGCSSAPVARSWCTMHYMRWRRNGDPVKSAWVKGDTVNSFWKKVKKTDSCWIWVGAQINTGYGSFRSGGRSVLAHRFSWELLHGSIPERMEVDHQCHNPLCVNPSHLRLATSKQNKENHSGPTRVSTSGVRGVSWNKKDRKWMARVGHNGVTIRLGRFDDLEDAKKAVIAKRNELFTHNNLDRIEEAA